MLHAFQKPPAKLGCFAMCYSRAWCKESRLAEICAWLGAVITVYVPNAGQGLKRIDYRLQSWCALELATLVSLCALQGVAAHFRWLEQVSFSAVVLAEQGRRFCSVPDRPPCQEARHRCRHARRSLV